MTDDEVRKRSMTRAESFFLALALSALWIFIVHTHKAAWEDILLVWLLGLYSGGLLVAWVDKKT